MFRSLATWSLLLTLLFSVGCGGGSSSDSGSAQDSASQGGTSASGAAMGGAVGMAPMSDPGSAAGGTAAGGTAGGAPTMMPSGPPPGTGPNAGGTSADPAAMAGGYAGGMNRPEAASTSADPAAMAAYQGGQNRPDAAGGAPDPTKMAEQYGAGGYPGAEGRSADDATGGASIPSAENYGPPGGTRPGTESADAAAGAINYAPGAEGRGEPGAAGAFPGGYPGAEGRGEVAAKEPPKTLDGKAQWSFEQGKERDGMAYWYGYGLTTDEGASQVLGAMRWAPGLKRPALAIRWGTGVQLAVKHRDYQGDYKPIGSTQNLPTKGGPRGNDGSAEATTSAAGFAGAEGYGTEGSGGGGNPVLAKHVGELGEKLLEGYRKRLEQGDFGNVLRDAPKPASGGGAAGGFGEGAYGAAGAAMNPKAGPGGYPGMRGGPGGAGGAGGAGGEAGADVQMQILPGLTLLGMGSSKDLIGKAKADGIDYLLLFDVTVTPSTKTGLITNDTTIEIYDVATNKKLHTSKPFNNIQVQRYRQENKDDGIEKEIERLFGVIDTSIKFVDLPPALNETNVTARVTKLSADHKPDDNPLLVLGEIRMYNVKGLLDEAKFTAACEQIVGPLGKQLATGTPEERELAIRRWLPQGETEKAN